MKNLGFRRWTFKVIVFLAFLITGCDSPEVCDPETYEPHCEGNVRFGCQQSIDEQNYSEETTVHVYHCPESHPFCLEVPYNVGCSMTEDPGHCGKYPGNLGGYCEGQTSTKCHEGVVYERKECTSEQYCFGSGCAALPLVREAVVGQSCSEICIEFGCDSVPVLGPYVNAPSAPIEVSVGKSQGFLEMVDGDEVSFDNCEGPPDALDGSLENVISQFCYCRTEAS